MTPAESARLRQVSYERQLARGFKCPGYAGLVAEHFGDAEPYRPRGLLQSESGGSEQAGAPSSDGIDESMLASRV